MVVMLTLTAIVVILSLVVVLLSLVVVLLSLVVHLAPMSPCTSVINKFTKLVTSIAMYTSNSPQAGALHTDAIRYTLGIL